MADDNLDNLDETKPIGSQIPVSQLDDFDRETRRFLKGWGLKEHTPSGGHKFLVGTTNQRPASPVTGQIFINVSFQAMEYWNGSTWVRAAGEPPGTIAAYAGLLAPAGWIVCNGQEIPRSQFPELYAAIGGIYGDGNGSTTFNVPNLNGRIPVGLSNGDPNFGTIGFSGGAAEVVLSVAEMPNHTHGVLDPGHSHVTADGQNINTVGTGVNNSNGPDGGQAGLENSQTGIAIAGAGGSEGHSNLQPYLVMNWIIRT